MAQCEKSPSGVFFVLKVAYLSSHGIVARQLTDPRPCYSVVFHASAENAHREGGIVDFSGRLKEEL